MLGHTEAASQSHVARTAQHKLIISALPQLAQRNWERQSRQGDEPEISKAPYGAHGTSVCSFTGLPGSVSTWHGEVSKQRFPPLPNPGRPGRRIPTALTRATLELPQKEALQGVSHGDPLQEQRGQTMEPTEKDSRSAQVLGKINVCGHLWGLIPFWRRVSL